MTNFESLIEEVLRNSNSQYWESAVQEWEISDVIEDKTLSKSCLCGHPNLKYLFTITNKENGNELFPIGSECIKKFNRDELYDEAKLKEQLFNLYHAVEMNKFLSLSSELFSRKLLKYLYEIGSFKATEYNNFCPENDYNFLLKMFNARTRTAAQDRKVKAIILSSIKPFIIQKLKDKIR